VKSTDGTSGKETDYALDGMKTKEEAQWLGPLLAEWAKVPLKRACDRGRNVRRTSAGQGRLHRNGRNIDVRKWRNRQFEESYGTGHQKPQRQKRGSYRTADERTGEIHQIAPSKLLPTTFYPATPRCKSCTMSHDVATRLPRL